MIDRFPGVTKRTFLEAALAPIFLATQSRLNACSLAMCLGNNFGTGLEMQPTFVVQVRHGKGPLHGASVSIRTNKEGSRQAAFTGFTDAAGKLRITNLPPGDYSVDIDFLGISAGSQCFHVRPEPSTDASGSFRFEWGHYTKTIHSVSGRVVESVPANENDPPVLRLARQVDAPLKNVGLRLSNVLSGAVVEVTSREDGTFDFGAVPNGTYVLFVHGGSARYAYDDSVHLLEVSLDGAQKPLLLKRREVGCCICASSITEIF